MTAQNPQYDQLTGLLSRAAFEEQFKTVINAAQEMDTSISLAFLDIDEFMHINEDYSHSAGDMVLQTVANTIQEIVGTNALAVRYGGDEFAILFPDTEREQAFLALEGIRIAIEGRQSFGDGKDAIDEQLTISGGIASYPIDGNTESEVLRKADQAMYRAKLTGRNSIRLAYEERMSPKTSHYTLTQLERLSKLAKKEGVGEAVLLRESLDDLLLKYQVTKIES
ncbi:MAG: GGDEF domain-containing protein [Chloroflexi bacterium]|nr:GGDEF domain-containing protein [Chloroflexota bacterium]MBU1661035.1 GGDEF domain-containing protein [Chloroflexota bacterium]